MTFARVLAGGCGFESEIKVTKLDKSNVRVEITSPCPALPKMNDEMESLDCNKSIFAKITDSLIYQIAGKWLKHAD